MENQKNLLSEKTKPSSARPETVARDRKPQPHRAAPPPVPPQPLPEVRPDNASQVRLRSGGGGLLCGGREDLPQDDGPHLRLAAEDLRRKDHHLQLLRHHVVPYDPYWLQARKMCLMELFSVRRLKSYEYIQEEMSSLLRELRAGSGRPLLLKDFLSTVSLNVISRMVLGRRYLDGGENAVVSPEEFKKMLDELFLLNRVLNIGDLIPYINFLDLQGYVKRMKVVSKKFDRFLEHVLDEHEAKRRKTGPGDYASKDMVDVLLELAEDPTLEVKLERHGVKAFTQDLLAGGTESSAVTVEWAISELLKKPESFKKATKELDRVIGQHRWVKEKDIPNLPFVEAIVKETMRLHLC
ncbi:hypothetical protein OROHE_016986 [Orobanche hederae]